MSIGFQYESATVSTEWSYNDRHPVRNGITAIRWVRARGSRAEAGFAGARSAALEAVALTQHHEVAGRPAKSLGMSVATIPARRLVRGQRVEVQIDDRLKRLRGRGSP